MEATESLRGVRLLVVEDDASSREMLNRWLVRLGATVDAVADGYRAIDAVAVNPYDLVLLDLEMPRMSGFEVLKRVRETRGPMELPVIIVTARQARKDVVEALEGGANDYVTKPLDLPVVFARLQTQLAHKRAVDRIVQLEADVRRRNQELEQANLRMKRSLDLAGKMQQALLPPGPMSVAGFDFAWIYEPCDELGGDILNVFPLGPGYVGLYVLDVSGHGVPAALLSVALSHMFAPVPNRTSLVERRATPDGPLEPRPPAEVAAELNRRFQISADGHAQFFTLFYGLLDLTTRRLRYVSAGHPPALLVPATGEPRRLDCQSAVLGCYDDCDFEEGTIDFADGDRFFLYSDGVVETKNADGKLFGFDRLLSACCADAASPRAALAGLSAQMVEFRGGAPVLDDVSALALRVNPHTTYMSTAMK